MSNVYMEELIRKSMVLDAVLLVAHTRQLEADLYEASETVGEADGGTMYRGKSEGVTWSIMLLAPYRDGRGWRILLEPPLTADADGVIFVPCVRQDAHELACELMRQSTSKGLAVRVPFDPALAEYLLVHSISSYRHTSYDSGGHIVVDAVFNGVHNDNAWIITLTRCPS